MSTKFDAEAIKAAAGNIGKLMDDMSAFEALKPHWPNAGQFKLAVWLERVVDDRRNGIVAHAEHLKIAFENIEEKLNAIANNFQNADGDNADKIKSSLGKLEGEITEEVTNFDEKTESEQHNLSDDPNNPGDKPDGDGYNDNVNNTVTT
jgi:gas vesicle protein